MIDSKLQKSKCLCNRTTSLNITREHHSHCSLCNWPLNSRLQCKWCIVELYKVIDLKRSPSHPYLQILVSTSILHLILPFWVGNQMLPISVYSLHAYYLWMQINMYVLFIPPLHSFFFTFNLMYFRDISCYYIFFLTVAQ